MKLMVVKVEFEKGGVGNLHQHYHSQITHIESGKFEVEIDGVKNCFQQATGFIYRQIPCMVRFVRKLVF